MTRYTKDTIIEAWRELEPREGAVAETIPVIPYKTEGSKYGAGGIRIDGPPEFIDAVLARLKDLLDAENSVTRLDVSRRVVEGTLEIAGKKKIFASGDGTNEVCYVRVCERGGESRRMNSMFDKAGNARAERFLALNRG